MLIPLLLLNIAATVCIIIIAADGATTTSNTNGRQFFDKSIPDAETVLTEEDFQRIRRHKRQTASEMPQQQQATNEEPVDDSAMYNKERFEGDIVNPGLNARTLKSTLEDAYAMTKMPGLMRNAVRQPYLKWSNAKIPYTVSKQYNTFGRDRIAEALEEYRTKTCVEFRPKTDADTDYVHILPDDGCYSLVGKVGGKQPVSLGDGCMSKGIIIHELMHAVGFFHEQSRADRDDYVNILWENIEIGLQDQFDKYSLNMIDYLGAKYDYSSVMHYGPSAFSKNGKPTIEPKQRGVSIGQRIDFSPTDLYKINRLYSCPNRQTPASSQVAAPDPVVLTQQPTPSSPLGIVVPSPAPPNGVVDNSGGGNGGGNGNINIGVVSNRCVDLRPDCAYLAGRGHCESIFSSAFMQVNCAQSCGRCVNGGGTAIGVSCDDQREWCGRWAASGMCDLYIFQQYMHLNCPHSCAVC